MLTLVLLVLLFYDSGAAGSGPACACGHESMTINSQDSGIAEYTLVASVSCLEGTCGQALEHGGDSSMCQFNVTYEVMRHSAYGSYRSVSDDDEELEYQTFYAPDQELYWEGGNTDDWTDTGLDATVKGEQNYWVRCGTTKELVVSFEASQPIREVVSTFVNDSLTKRGEVWHELALKTRVLLKCDACARN